MTYDLSNDIEAEKFKERVNALYASRAIVVLTKWSPRRTSQQNAYLHVLLGYFGAEFGYDLAYVKQEIFKREVNPAIFITQAHNRHGEEYERIRSSRELTTAEMTTAIERFRNYSSSNGLYLPAPSDDHHLAFACRMIEQNKEYL